MTQEEKAQRYDEALERAKGYYAPDCHTNLRIAMENLFPELKESGEERIRKAIGYAIGQSTHSDGTLINGVSSEEALAWLEKQNSNVDNANKEYWRGYRDGKQETLDKYAELEKQGEQKQDVNMQINPSEYINDMGGNGCYLKNTTQKTVDKVEHKFKIEDWVFIEEVKGYKNGPFQIKNVDSLGYSFDEYHTIPFMYEDLLSKWTIQDAKDGDVVVDKSDGAIGIFQSIGHYPDGGSYNDHSYCFLHCRYDDGFFYADFEHGNTIDSDDLIPSTKEQRDTLMKAMADAGYTFDFDKEELKKTNISMI